jgi:NAD(P)-dependent dehydrogenase (short-subunit alcohol dehydrogenase family)
VVGASSGLGRCIGVGLGQRGARVALLARRLDRLERAAAEAGSGALAVECDVTDATSCNAAIGNAAAELGGIDALVYTPAIAPLAKLTDVDSESWHRVFDTNVVGAAQITTAVLPHLTATKGTAMYLSSVSASLTPPWPGLGAYVVSKAALDKLVEAWRVEEPSVNFTRCIVGDCRGGAGESATGFADNWDWELLCELHAVWTSRGLLAGAFIDPEHLVEAIDGVLRGGTTLAVPTVILGARPPASQA